MRRYALSLEELATIIATAHLTDDPATTQKDLIDNWADKREGSRAGYRLRAQRALKAMGKE